jgi:hypothetical protein
MPVRPWQRIAVDLMEFKKVQYLVVVDYFSRYIELSNLESTLSASIINHLKSIMARHGVPETLVSDNGPQFASKEFVVFAKDMANGYSPAELLMSRKIRTELPELPQQLQPALPDLSQLQTKEETSRTNMKISFDKHHAAKVLPVLKRSEEVWINDRKESGIVESQSTNRSYIVKTPTATVRRNRVQLNKLANHEHAPKPSSEPPEPHITINQPVKVNQPVPQHVTVLNAPKPPEQSFEKTIQTRSGRVIKKPARFVPQVYLK